MTENEAIKELKKLRLGTELREETCLSLDAAISALEEIQQYREFSEIFKNHFSDGALKLLSDREEFAKWLERGRWIAKRCDEINRELEQYHALGTVKEFMEVMKKGT